MLNLYYPSYMFVLNVINAYICAMKKNLYIILSLLSLFSCTNDGAIGLELERVNSIIEKDADSAYIILNNLASKEEGLSESNKMRYNLLLADAQNKLSKQMLSDSVFQKVVEYYDHNGTANEQLKAHYLLGCIYRDMREAPVALQCYYDAVEKADTISENCDYLTLMSVWGQIAVVLYYQHMPNEQLVAWHNYSKYAKKIGDVYNTIRGIDLSTMAYSQKGDTAKVIEMTHQLFDMYKENGFEQEAYSVYPPLIDILISRGKYDEAFKYMEAYETKSGLFVNGEVEEGRQLYYQSKGYYFCGVNKLDSAEYYFRKLLNFDDCRYESYRGLASVYCEKGDVDSVVYFTKCQEMALDTLLSSTQIEASQQALSMYDYSRLQRIADEKRAEAKLNALLLVFAIFVFAVVVVALYFIHMRYRAAKTAELETLNDSYEKTKTDYVQVMENLTEQTEEYEQFKKEKLTEVEDLKSKYNDLKSKDDEVALLNTPFISSIRDILSPFSSKPCMNNADLDELLVLVREYLPRFFMEITKNDSLSQQELYVCILLRLNFSSKDLSVLLNTSSSGIANAKKRANEKLFGLGKANVLITNLKKMGAEDNLNDGV